MAIYSKESIKAGAIAAAKAGGPHYVNPYFADSDAAALFVKYFEIERAQLAREDAIQPIAAAGIKANMHNYKAIPT
jgi:hypothetical protein